MKLYLIITAVSILMLRILGATWVETIIAIAIATSFAYGTVWAHRWIERRVNKTCSLRSELSALTFFAIGLGISTPPIYLFPESHFLVFLLIGCIAFSVAALVAHWFFGESLTDVTDSDVNGDTSVGPIS